MKTEEFESDRAVRWVALAVLAGLSLAGALMVWAGTYMRPMTDDYLFEHYLRELGALQTALWWYQEWQGRWVSQAIGIGLYGTGYWFIPVLPVVLAVVWASGGYLVVRRLGGDKVFAAAVTGGILSLTFLVAPDLITGFYWAAASLYHVLPMVLSPWLLWILISESRSPGRLAGIALFSVLITGMSELFDVWLVPAMLVFALLRRDKYAWVAFVAAALGMLVVVSAPGNMKRSSVYPGKISVGDALGQAVHWCGYLWEHFLQPELVLGLVAVFLLAYAGGMSEAKWKPRLRWAVLCAGVGIIATYGCLLVVMIATHGTPPQIRVYLVPTFISVAGMMAGTVVLGIWVRENRRTRRPDLGPVLGLAVIGILVVSGSLLRAMYQVGNMQWFQREWTNRDESLRRQVTAGQKDLYCKRLPVFQYDIALDPGYYVNVYMAYHYAPGGKVRVVLRPD